MLEHPHLAAEKARLIKLGNKYEYWTMLWNLLSLAVLKSALVLNNSIALHSITFIFAIHIFVSAVILSQLNGIDRNREQLAMKVISLGYTVITLYVLARGVIGLIAVHQYHANHLGIIWLGLTYFVMWALSTNKRRVGHALQNQTLVHVASMNQTFAYIVISVVAGLLLNAFCDIYWCDSLAALFIAGYACEEGIAAWRFTARVDFESA